MTMLNDTGISLGKRLRIARQMADLEQSEIAAILGVARTTVSTWERGQTEPSATNFVRWAQVTNQPLEWLAEGIARPKGLEPLTFWLGAWDWSPADDDAFRAFADATAGV
jgi:transcriptional regulator with XRE-family HTH domain